MQMCKLSEENFDETISKGANSAQNRSLLAKMSKLKKQILTKKYGEKVPQEAKNSDSDEQEQVTPNDANLAIPGTAQSTLDIKLNLRQSASNLADLVSNSSKKGKKRRQSKLLPNKKIGATVETELERLQEKVTLFITEYDNVKKLDDNILNEIQ